MCVIQTGAYITADMVVEDNVFIGPEVSTSNDKHVKRSLTSLKGPYLKNGASVRNNATLLPGIVIGKCSIIGAGSFVTKDVLDSTVTIGNPAKEINSIKGRGKK